jgi:predicted enzyme related to lactoylglutathione lyase
MMKVDSADGTAEKVASLGGKAMPPFDVMDKGRMAVCFDPNGAQFDVWESRASSGTDVDPTLHGAPSWIETITSDLPRATAFYSKLFGWTSVVRKSAGIDYTVFSLDSQQVAGMMQITPEMGKMPSHWGVYYTVKNADETMKSAIKLGASICMTMKEAEGVGRFCGITSPQGVMFYAIEYKR